MSNLAMMMGLGSAAGGVNVADVFSTDLYTSDGNNRDVVNGLDLAGEGGLVWFKIRNLSGDHSLFDTERGALKLLSSNSAGAESTQASSLTAFNSDGYSIGTSGYVNYSSGYNYVSWAWRQAPKFFDVLTYTGTGTAGQTVSHNLGSVPGMIIIKRLGTTSDWVVYHRSIGATASLRLDSTRSTSGAVSSAWFNDTEPTATEFSIGTVTDINASGSTYVAYLFAHNEDLIQCGTYTGNGSTTGPIIDLGWQPQWVMIKNTSSAADWYVLDAERGLNGDAIDDPYLRPNLSNVESSTNILKLTATGFQLNSAGLAGVNANGNNYIYMAIKAED